MKQELSGKLSVDEIRKKFESEDVVRRFSNIETGQVAAVDAVVNLEILTEIASRIAPHARNVLDVGCGAGNYTLKLLSKLPDLNCTLVDLSANMLSKAAERVTPATSGNVTILQGDVRVIDLPHDHFGIAIAGAVLHHLREETEWKDVYQKIFEAVSPGGCFLVSDLIVQSDPRVEAYMWQRYEEYINRVEGPETFERIRESIASEDSPRTILFQLDLLRQVGFKHADVFHKNALFASFGAIK